MVYCSKLERLIVFKRTKTTYLHTTQLCNMPT